MTKRLVAWFILVPLCAALVVFALANRHAVPVNFNPLVTADPQPEPGMGVPLFLIIYAVLLVGVLLGGVATWFAQRRQRIEMRRYQRRTEQLRGELDAARRGPVPDPADNDLVGAP